MEISVEGFYGGKCRVAALYVSKESALNANRAKQKPQKAAYQKLPLLWSNEYSCYLSINEEVFSAVLISSRAAKGKY